MGDFRLGDAVSVRWSGRRGTILSFADIYSPTTFPIWVCLDDGTHVSYQEHELVRVGEQSEQ